MITKDNELGITQYDSSDITHDLVTDYFESLSKENQDIIVDDFLTTRWTGFLDYVAERDEREIIDYVSENKK